MTRSTPRTGHKATTALVASLSLMMPSLAQIASAQTEDREVLLCEGLLLPPCEEGDPMPVAIADIPADRLQELIDEVQARDDLNFRDLVVTADMNVTAEADAAAAEQAAADQAAADAAAAEQAAADQAAADAAAAEQAAADQAAADAAVAEQAAADQAAADAAAAEQAAADQAAADAAAAEQAAADRAAADAAAAEQAAADQAAADAAAAEQAAAEQAAADAAAAEQAAAESSEPESAIEANTTAETSTPEAGDIDADTSAETAQVEPPAAVDPTVEDADAAESLAAAAGDATDAVEAEVVEETISDNNSRSSTEEFSTAVTAAATAEADSNDDSGMSNFEKALLLGLGAVAVGSVLRNGDQVVANTGDRVIVQGENGLTVYKDDDALLRQPGGTIRTETFADGSTRSVLMREDGTQVVTIRDANGRVLRRARVLEDGSQVELFDDLTASEPVDVVRLRAADPQQTTMTLSSADRAALAAALAAAPAYDTGRTYSLRQIREIREVRDLVPGIDLDTLTFASGSAAIRPEQTESLVRLGLVMERALANNPREVFLIEGHTDATGSDSLNLALSDRRAETVALALTEVFDIPPENLVVQGYGEAFLKVQTQSAEEANRRATVRRITPLLRQVASN